MTDITPDKLVEAYINIRDAIADKNAEVDSLKEQQKAISDRLLELCAEKNLDGFKTEYGTVNRRLSSHYWTSDWEQFYQFVKDNDAFHLLEKRIHNTNMKEFLANKPEGLPEGLQCKNEYAITVRKPTAK
jgi:hypothetical protein